MARGTKFTEAELDRITTAAEADTGSTVDDSEWEVIPPGDGMAIMSMRLPASTIAALKTIAAREGVGATTLARTWITERLLRDGELAGTVSVSELADFLATHAHPQAS